MRNTFLGIIRCPTCKKSLFHMEEVEQDETEVREGELCCVYCGASYEISEGIVNFLKDPGPCIRKEQDAVDREEYFQDREGKRYRVDRDSIQRFKEQLLLLPEGDGSCFFRRGGCFQPIAEASHRFYDTFKRMGIRGNETIISLGDGFGYASYKFVGQGCKAVALDISSYLLAADLYVKHAYFERVFSDMHSLPFNDAVFDIVFCSAVLHHSKELKNVFSEMRRVLKPGGRVFVINESSRGLFEKVNPGLVDLRKRGYGDTAYTIPQWLNAADKAGLKKVKIEFLSLADDYVKRQENKGAELRWLLRLAYFLQKHRGFEKAALVFLKYSRIFFKPKSWRLTCSK